MDRGWNPKRAAAAQSKYCNETGQPLIAPGDGICFHCYRNIYLPTNGSHGAVYGYTIEQAAERLITSCPHCGRSFTD